MNLTGKLRLIAFIERFYCNRVYENGIAELEDAAPIMAFL